MKIVYAEDDQHLHPMVVQFLKDDGHEVVGFYDGNAALDYLKSQNYQGVDLILTDNRMPKMTGLQLTAVVKTESTIPVICCSTDVEDPQFRHDFFIKTFHKLQVKDAIKFIKSLCK